MIYNIIYDAVKKKTTTNPPNIFIGNVEMAAGMGIVLGELGMQMNFEKIDEPGKIKDKFNEIMKESDVSKLSDMSNTIIELINRYQVKDMVNETMEDLEILVNRKEEKL
ncbi:MAG: DUF3837 family protein [Lachnospiraceae bacterium]|nr:DUF3837 domain-containing protein [Clostridiales bacterium]MDD6292792.1 DUF3837 family protein [Eubacteriales bacterium]MDY2606728.1 DUF3837 family protein [Lachnospiraceae bacterium]MDY6329088.1 DUF3837 family protein [Lachnospiraceae bacterium]